MSVPQAAHQRTYYLSTPSANQLYLKVTDWNGAVIHDGYVDVLNNPYDDGYFRTSRLANSRWYYIFRVIRQVNGTDSFLDTPEQILWYVSEAGKSTTFKVPIR